ncbi:unnamed protein product [Mycena citricolor]|uniref:Uncharacterized protein n=1 Tax=Mycena citricolor TaxID=2018698 RepID=A0AAD2K3I5_9AGAR|nr:unnamed protein product [Mycena citricolor]
MNTTIDDTDSNYFQFVQDIYANPPSWAAITPATPCLYCSAQPQTAHIHNQTWHDGSVGTQGSLTFQGSAVYIYGIDLTPSANTTFTLESRTTTHYYNGPNQFVFDALYFSATGLEEGVNHTVSWVVGKGLTNGTSALIDYAVITASAASPNSSLDSTTASSPLLHKKSNTGAIAGGTVAGVVVLLGLVLLLFSLTRWRRRRGIGTQADEADDSDAGPRVRNLRNRQPQRPVQPFVDTSSAPVSISQHQATSTASDTMQTELQMPVHNTESSTASTSGYSESRLDSKTMDTSWMNARDNGSLTSLSTSVGPRAPYSQPYADSSTEASTTISGSSARERFLEDRLAVLEAHVLASEPPPYQQPLTPARAAPPA